MMPVLLVLVLLLTSQDDDANAARSRDRRDGVITSGMIVKQAMVSVAPGAYGSCRITGSRTASGITHTTSVLRPVDAHEAAHGPQVLQQKPRRGARVLRDPWQTATALQMLSTHHSAHRTA